ncbi:LolA family protein [Natronorubrum sp. FCH18a]|uniref:LolA family protein n=1 Tax=Natronorubrum sp. FCH18a TaxID=3447018 RepID=UPI003F50E416
MSRADRTLPSVAVLILVLTVTVLGAGCVTFSGDDSTATEFEDELAATDPPAAVTATLEVTIDRGGERETITEPVWLRADGTSRIGDREQGSEFVRVDDGDRVWTYDGGDDAVTVRDSNATDTHYLEFAYTEQERYLEEYAVTTVEETTVDGHDAYRAAFDPPANETIERSVGIIVGDTEYVLPLETSDVDGTYADSAELVTDQERFFPLEYHVEAGDLELSITYSDVTFDERIDDDRFTFEPPESATVERESVSN